MSLPLFLKDYTDNNAVSCKRIGEFYGLDGDLFERQDKEHLSAFRNWDQLAHATHWVLFEKNMGAYLGIDEVALSRGELYTVLINKEAKGKKGSIVAIIKGTDVKTVCDVLRKMPRRRRFQAREITLDMAPNMELIARTCSLQPNESPIASMCRSWPLKLFKRCVSKLAGRH